MGAYNSYGVCSLWVLIKLMRQLEKEGTGIGATNRNGIWDCEQE